MIGSEVPLALRRSRSATVPESAGVTDLVTLDDFSRNDASYYERHDSNQFVAAVFMTAGFIAAFGTSWEMRGPPFWESLWTSLGAGVALGIAFGYLGFLADRREWRRTVRRRLERIFSGDADIVPPAPETATHRVVCAGLVGRRRMVGGILYVRTGGLTFQPHYLKDSFWRSLLKERTRVAPPALEIDPPSAITLSSGILKPRIHWLATKHPPFPYFLILKWGDRAAAFRVPQSAGIEPRLQACLDSLRAAG